MFLNKGQKTGMKALPRQRTERQWHWQKLRRKHLAAALWELREDTRASTVPAETCGPLCARLVSLWP